MNILDKITKVRYLLEYDHKVMFDEAISILDDIIIEMENAPE